MKYLPSFLIPLLFASTLTTSLHWSPSSIEMVKDTMLVVVYTETTGYNHGTDDECFDLYTDMADSLSGIDPLTHYKVVWDKTGATFTTSLMAIDTVHQVIFCNTSGNSGLSQSQRGAFEDYIRAGGNYVGIHAATDTYRHSTANGSKTGTWDWYAENVAGFSVQMNPNHTSSNHVDTNYVFSTPYSGSPFGPTLTLPYLIIKKEEYYYWENGYTAPGFTTIMNVGQTGGNSYDAPRPTAWFRTTQWGGCVCGTSWGHSGNNYTKTDYGEQGFYFKRLLWNYLVGGCVTVFSLKPPPPIVLPGKDPKYQLEQLPPPGLRFYEIYTIGGQLLEEGTMDDLGIIPMKSDPGLYLYKTYSRAWVSGVK